MRRIEIAAVRVTVSVLSALLAGASYASDPPVSAINPASGHVQVVDASWTGSNYDVRHVTEPGPSQEPTVEILTTSPLDDVHPRIAVSPLGDTWVVWEREGSVGQVFFRWRASSSGSWSTERALSQASEDARHPRVVHDGAVAWVAFETEGPCSTGIEVSAIQDDPNPYGPLSAVAVGTAEPDLRLESESGQVWATWLEGTADVVWSAYDARSRAWSALAYEPVGSDGVAGARSRIRASVLGR